MANTVTNYGQGLAISDVAGGIAQVVAKLKLYNATSTPAKTGVGFNEVANGNGYVTGGIAVVFGDWVADLFGGNQRIRLKPSGLDAVWTAVGGSIPNIAGAFVTDNADAVIAWWPRTGGAVTIAPGETITLKDLALVAN